MSATERLRELLDERGVEYKDRDMFGKHVFHWGEPLHGAMFTDGGEWTELVVENASPEQAIAATLGAGTCKLTRADWDDGTCTWGCICSACDAHLEHETGIGYNFCPICGAKVVDE